MTRTLPAVASSLATPWRVRDGVGYGALGLPLAFCALPLYVVLPNHYAAQFGVPLAALGLLLLLVRCFDALVDPWLGGLADRLQARGSARVRAVCAAAGVVLALAFVALFFPPGDLGSATDSRYGALLVWAGVALVLAYTAYSLISVAHQAWGARLGGDEAQRARIVGWREGFGLLGVVLASALPSWVGLPVSTTVFVVTLALGLWLWRWAPTPVMLAPTAATPPVNLAAPLRDGRFVRLLAVFVINGMASAVPATLVLFFVQDRLQASPAQEPLFLLAYFACAAMAIPLWLRLVGRIGLVRAWGAGMVLSIAVFAWASTLGAGDIAAFLVICALSGAALGGDLACPPALLAGQLQADANATKTGAAPADKQAAGAYFGWWNMAAKLSLALAAGVALPLLGWAGYEPGTRSEQGLLALTLAYCVLPCVLKALALAALLAYRRTITQSTLGLPLPASQAA